MMTGKAKSSAAEAKKDRKGKDSLFCPFIGFEDDPTTALAYPARYNFCFHAKPVAPVNLAHQRSYCLSDQYPDCPVFQNENLGALPKGIRGERISKFTGMNWLSIIALLFVIALGLAATILTGLIPVRGFKPPLADFTFATQPPPAQTVVTPAKKPTATPELTATALPTATMTKPAPIATTPRALETPFGSSPQLVIHKVVAGEGFILLAENFNTTVDAIKAINYELPASLWEDKILVIPINTDDVSGMPPFTVIEIKAEGMTIEMYAERMQLDVEQLIKYNDLPVGYTLKMGEFLIIPMNE